MLGIGCGKKNSIILTEKWILQVWLASFNQHLFGLFSAPFYIDMYSEDFGTVESCGKQSHVLPSDIFQGWNSTFFHDWVKFKINQSNNTSRKTKTFCHTTWCIESTSNGCSNQAICDEGITFMDSICSWKCWCVFLSKILCTKNEQNFSQNFVRKMSKFCSKFCSKNEQILLRILFRNEQILLKILFEKWANFLEKNEQILLKIFFRKWANFAQTVFKKVSKFCSKFLQKKCLNILRQFCFCPEFCEEVEKLMISLFKN